MNNIRTNAVRFEVLAFRSHSVKRDAERMEEAQFLFSGPADPKLRTNWGTQSFSYLMVASNLSQRDPVGPERIVDRRRRVRLLSSVKMVLRTREVSIHVIEVEKFRDYFFLFS
uniref:Uncharacterized protein n=1 Tax=Strigamia maritima TaxID=126957 RepID=T1J603_STRMM